MADFYAHIKSVHIFVALLSGALFTLRGAGALLGAEWPTAWLARWSSYAIDTTLLTVALMLLTILHLNPFVTPWLAVKLTLLLLYIVLGWFALKHGGDTKWGLSAYLAALACFAFMYSVARAHHPLGLLRSVFS